MVTRYRAVERSPKDLWDDLTSGGGQIIVSLPPERHGNSPVNPPLARQNTLPCIYALERDAQALLAVSNGHRGDQELTAEKNLMHKFQAHPPKSPEDRAGFHLNFARIRAHS